MATTVRMDPPNWVKARADCNLAMTFDALFSVARRDVEEANNIEALTKEPLAKQLRRAVFLPE